MYQLQQQLKPKLTLIFFIVLTGLYGQATANSDRESREQYLKMLEQNQQQNSDHANHVAPLDKSLEFHGVFYGFLPCKDCNGIKATLSLKQKNNYLLVTQPAKESSREVYEKGKYTWDETTRTVVLTPKNEGEIRQYHIENEGTLIQLNSDGSPMAGEKEKYSLRRSDTVKNREVHIH